MNFIPSDRCGNEAKKAAVIYPRKTKQRRLKKRRAEASMNEPNYIQLSDPEKALNYIRSPRTIRAHCQQLYTRLKETPLLTLFIIPRNGRRLLISW